MQLVNGEDDNGWSWNAVNGRNETKIRLTLTHTQTQTQTCTTANGNGLTKQTGTRKCQLLREELQLAAVFIAADSIKSASEIPESHLIASCPMPNVIC